VPISLQDVEHIAHLARLGLTDAEKATLQDQLSAILEHMRALNQLDTSEISPTAQVIPLHNVMRADEVRPSLPREAVLANAPDRDADFLRVPPVLE
jgi:aspartyl-tRNA(Asn)/glutamyl-tRNA(Gln) amidotransferase subunit C